MAELTIKVKASVKEAKQSILSLQNAFAKVDNKVNRTAEAFKKLPEALEGTDKAPGVTKRMVDEFVKLQTEVGRVVNLIAAMNPALTSATEGIGAYKQLGESLAAIAKIEPDSLAKAKTYISELVPEAQKLANVQFKDIAPNGADFKGASASVTALKKDLESLSAVFQSTKKSFDGLGSSFVTNATILREGGVEFGNNIAATVKAASSATEKQIERAGQAMAAIKGMGGAFSGNAPKGGADIALFAPALSSILSELGKVPEVTSKARDELVSFIGALALSTTAMEQKAPVFANMVKAIYGAFAGASESGVGDIRSVVSAFTGLGNAMAVLGKGDTPARISSVAKAIRDMGEAASGMGSVGAKVTDFARGLSKLPAAVTSMSRFTLNSDYPNRVANMGKAIKDLNDAAGGIKPEVARAIANMGDGLSQLSKAGIDPEMPSKLQRLGEGVRSFASMVAPNNSLDLQSTASALTSFVKNAENISTKISDDAGARLVQLATDISRALLILGNVAPGVNFESIAQGTGALKNILKAIREMFATGESLEFAQAGASGIASVMRTLVGDFQGLSVGDNVTAIGNIARQIGYFANGLKGISTSDIRAKGDALEAFFLQMNAVFAGKDMSGLQNAAPALQAFARTLQGVGRKNLSTDFTEVSKTITEFVTKLSALPDAAVNKFERIAIACNKAWEAVRHLNASEKALEKSQKGGLGKDIFGASFGDIKMVTSKVAAAWAAVKKTIEAIKRVITGVVNEAMKLWKVAGKIASAFGKIAKPVMNFLNGGTFKKSGLAKFLSKLGSIIKYRLIRTALRSVVSAAKEGLQNLYQYSVLLNNMDSAKAMGGLNELATTALYLKNTLGAMLMPIINALMPLINALAEAFVRVANAVNAFVSALMGLGTFTAAKRYAKSFGDELGGAADKAKELEKTILGFDEINRLNDNKDNAGGGGADALDFAEMFEPRNIPEWIKEIAKLFKKGKWKEIGDIITVKLTDAMNGVKWGEIGANFGKKFATILGVLATIVHEFPWDELGSNLATAFNKFLNSMNSETGFYNLGQLIMSRFMILIETIGSFIANLDPLQLAEGFSQFAIGVVDAIIETLSETPWQTIVDKIVEFISNIRWNDVLDKMTEMLKLLDPVKIIEAFFSVLSAVPWADIITTITEWLRGIDWPKLEQDIYDFITSDDFLETVQAFVDGIGAISEHFSDVTDKIAEALGTAVGSVDWGAFVQGIIDAAISAWTFKLNIFASGVLQGTGYQGYNSRRGNGLSANDYAFASGGFPDAGSVFLAGESGPEFVGNIGGQTGVMNTDQMAQSVASGNARVETLLVELIRAVNNKDFDVSLDGKSLSDQMRKYDRQNARAYG